MVKSRMSNSMTAASSPNPTTDGPTEFKRNTSVTQRNESNQERGREDGGGELSEEDEENMELEDEFQME